MFIFDESLFFMYFYIPIKSICSLKMSILTLIVHLYTINVHIYSYINTYLQFYKQWSPFQKFFMILIEVVIFYAKSDVTLFAPNRNFMSPIILQTSLASSWLFKLSWPVGQATISSYCWCLPFPDPPILSNHLLGKSDSIF